MADVITAVITHAEAVSALVLAYGAWRDSRRQKATITLTTGNVTVSVSDASAETIDHVRKLLAEHEGR